MKYIIFDIMGSEYPVVFSARIDHSAMKQFMGWDVYSAGKVTLGVDKDGNPRANCIVGSVTLGIKFNGPQCDGDSDILTRHFQNY